jgi:hypothetical protein
MRDKDWGKLVARAATCLTPDQKTALAFAAFTTQRSMSAVIRHALEVETNSLRRLAEKQARNRRATPRVVGGSQ